MYAFSLLGSFTVTLVMCTCERYLFRGYYTAFEGLLGIITNFTLGLLFLSIIFSHWKRQKSWENFLENLSAFDDKVPIHQMKNHEKKLKFLKYLIIYSTPLFNSVVNTYVWLKFGSEDFFKNIPLYVTQQAGLFYEIALSGYLWEISCILESRYQYLSEYMQNIIPKKALRRHISQYLYEDGIRNVKYKYSLLNEAVKEINAVFGWIMLFVLCHALMLFLFVFYYALKLYGLNAQLSVPGFPLTFTIVVSN